MALQSESYLSQHAAHQRMKQKKQSSKSARQIVIYFATNYPLALAGSVVGLLLASTAEGLGVAALLPLLGQLTGSKANLPPPADRLFDALFSWFGVVPSAQTLMIIMTALILIRVALTFVVMTLVGRISAVVTEDFRKGLIKALSQAQWTYFAHQPVGRAANALSQEAGEAGKGLQVICQVAAGIVQAVIFALIALAISWQAVLIGICAGGLSLAVLSRLVRLARENSRERMATTSDMIARLVDTLTNMKTLKAMGAEGRAINLLGRDIAAIRRNHNKNIFLKQSMDSVQELFKLASLIAVFVFLLNIWESKLESVVVVLVLFLRMIQSIAQVQRYYQGLIICEAPFEHVQYLIKEAQSLQESTGGKTASSLEFELRIDNVSFAYGAQGVLEKASLAVHVGNLVCLTGPSGAGKTTLIDLICGLARPQSGDVFIDGIPMAEIDLSAWRQNIGYVPQELILFHDTLLANVTMGDLSISEADVEEALRAAGAWEFVRTLPERLNTIVGERGMRFSGGQRQRISIARALVRRPRLLILDEVTASLDPANEREICRTLTALRGRTTMIAATHQAALTGVADAVYCVDGGNVSPVSLQTLAVAENS
jgi:ATP-binding cassette subfamily C protein